MDKPGMSPRWKWRWYEETMDDGVGDGPIQMCKGMTSSIKKVTSLLTAFTAPSEPQALFSK